MLYASFLLRVRPPCFFHAGFHAGKRGISHRILAANRVNLRLPHRAHEDLRSPCAPAKSLDRAREPAASGNRPPCANKRAHLYRFTIYLVRGIQPYRITIHRIQWTKFRPFVAVRIGHRSMATVLHIPLSTQPSRFGSACRRRALGVCEPVFRRLRRWL